MAQKIELIDRGIKTASINMLCMFEKIEESMNMLKKDGEKRPTLRDKNVISF